MKQMLEKKWHLRSLQEKPCPGKGVSVQTECKVEVMMLTVKSGGVDGGSGVDISVIITTVPNIYCVYHVPSPLSSHLILTTLQSSYYCSHFTNEKIMTERD